MAVQRQSTAERRQQIAEAALRILASQSPREFTASVIAREVGISEGTIFRHVKDKNEIVLLAIQALDRMCWEDLRTDDPQPLRRLKAFFWQRFDIMRRYPGVLRLSFSDQLARVGGDDSIHAVNKMIQRTHKFVLDCIGEAQRLGQVAPDLDVGALTRIVMGTLHATVMADQHYNELLQPPTTPSTVWETLESLLQGTPARR